MKPVWKWVIGIVIVLVVVAALVGGAFLLKNYLPLRQVAVAQRVQPGQVTPPFGNRDNRVPGFGMRGYGMRGFGMWPFGMHGYGMMGWGMMPFGGIFGALFSLGLLALLVLGIILLVRSLRTPKQVVEMHTCGNCGKPVQADWRNCPYCGKKL